MLLLQQQVLLLQQTVDVLQLQKHTADKCALEQKLDALACKHSRELQERERELGEQARELVEVCMCTCIYIHAQDKIYAHTI